MKIEQNCIINGMPEDVYHKDPTPTQAEGFKRYTSFSSSVGKAIVEETEIEAFMKIERFNPKKKADEVSDSDAVNLGSIMHDKVLLGGSKVVFEVVPFKDFRTKDARERKEDLISRGIVPLAQNEKTEDLLKGIKTMEQRLHEQLAAHRDFPSVMEKGKGEQSGFYFDEKLGIWKRARFDWLDEKYPDIVWDYKTTALTAERWVNQELWKEKYIQCPHYASVLSGINGAPAKFGFILQRTVEPYLVYIIVIDESFMEAVRDRYDQSVRRFVSCLKTDVWRGAPPYTIHACPPPWILNRWEEAALNDEYEARRIADEQKPEPEQDDPGKYLQAG